MAIDPILLETALRKGGIPARIVVAFREALRLYSKLVIDPLNERVEKLEAEVAELRQFKDNRTGDGK